LIKEGKRKLKAGYNPIANVLLTSEPAPSDLMTRKDQICRAGRNM
jgi:hypothetical protein